MLIVGKGLYENKNERMTVGVICCRQCIINTSLPFFMSNFTLVELQKLIRAGMNTAADENEEPIKCKDDFMDLVEEGIKEFSKQILKLDSNLKTHRPKPGDSDFHSY